jgi:anti-sigma factor RsiW
MLPKRPRRQDPDTLTWEYLDGDISPSRAQVLSNMLAEKASARQRFVEASMLHGMLFEYFKTEHSKDAQDQASDEVTPRRKRRRGRSSAA